MSKSCAISPTTPAKKSKAHGHDDWIVPPGYDDPNRQPDILNAIFNSKSKIGGFDVNGSSQSSLYWSSSSRYVDDGFAKVQRLRVRTH